ncbi:MAG: hypothetical protein C0603_03935 [Denitrovibrio sp.]|nr:MAG: hypothetical protein C0603_03935 [Denitrovibrio sp.]
MKIDKTILYVEDESITRLLICRQLKREFNNVYCVANGQEALELFGKVSPDIVITDLSMPVMSGFEMIQEIKKQDNTVLIIVVSAYRKETENIDVDCILTKPVDIRDLQSCIDKLIHKSTCD